MFHKVKTKLTFIYTCSLVLLLFSFIGILYLLISHQIYQQEIEELSAYYNKEADDFYDDFYEKEDHHKKKEDHPLKYEPEEPIFYYLYDQAGNLIYGKETNQELFRWIDNQMDIKSSDEIIKMEKGSQHFLLMKQEIGADGFVLIGKEITAQQHLIEKITWILLLLTIFFSLIFALLGYYFAGQAIKPIKRAFEKQEKFVSDASHELRTPLSIFYSSIDLLMTEEKDRLSPFGQEVLEDVKIEAQLMSKLVNDLLILARSDKNQLMLESKELNLSKLFTSIHQRFERKIPKDIAFRENIQPGILFHGDEVRIQELLYILLDNALRYTKAGEITLGLTENAGKITITVEDTGCGIAAEDLPLIFDRFYRADQMREKGGAGLGLSIAQTIVQAHGGEITVSSQLGKGSIFTVIFNQNNGSS
ncbi:HAMP domain-containing sensor histidine kinase [Neobacillus sp. OS1-32]|jgi:signal transduction histidine kinase|uniref:sensor histidine kinase n=1 Tax=Neobacillus sp. OS1-32 TaxID=3070682 RepID=UPI0027E13396|nr:HAMP domain-containing sensor histidine kinase [Neobacillus sp. OS1-32]WML31080.1 HAMP domain-containing sensor histidine kinase [Neobacillus sp. OS1-32]